MTESVAEAVDETGELAEEVEETPSDELEEIEEIPEEEEAEDSEEEPEEEEPAGEEREFTFGNDKFSASLPEEVAEKLDSFTKGVWSDYTRKSQAIAEQTKSLETQAEAVQTLASLNGEAMRSYATALAIQEDLNRYTPEALQAIRQENPEDYRYVSDELALKREQLTQAQTQLSQHLNEMQQAKGNERTRLMDEGRKYMEKVKGFAGKESEVLDYITDTYGLSRERVEDWPLNPSGMHMAYKAFLYDQMQNKIKTTGKPQIKKPSATPSMKGKGGKSAKDPSKMSMSEYMKWANSWND